MDRASLDPVMRYREYVEYQLAVDGEGIGLRQARQVLAGQGIESLEIMTLDALAIEAVQMVERINPVLLDDASDQPLTSWWWHLGKLRRERTRRTCCRRTCVRFIWQAGGKPLNCSMGKGARRHAQRYRRCLLPCPKTCAINLPGHPGRPRPGRVRRPRRRWRIWPSMRRTTGRT